MDVARASRSLDPWWLFLVIIALSTPSTTLCWNRRLFFQSTCQSLSLCHALTVTALATVRRPPRLEPLKSKLIFFAKTNLTAKRDSEFYFTCCCIRKSRPALYFHTDRVFLPPCCLWANFSRELFCCLGCGTKPFLLVRRTCGSTCCGPFLKNKLQKCFFKWCFLFEVLILQIFEDGSFFFMPSTHVSKSWLYTGCPQKMCTHFNGW